MNFHQEQLEKGGLLLLRQIVQNGIAPSVKVLQQQQPAACLIPVSRLREYARLHMLNLAYIRRLGKGRIQLCCLSSVSAGEIGINPVLREQPRVFRNPFRFTGLPAVPDKILQVLLNRLQAADIQHPYLTDARLPGFLQLIACLRQRDGIDEQIAHSRSRSGPVGAVEVEPVPAAAAAFGCRRITAHMPKVIIRPDQGQILRQLQPLVIQ
ncbi:hypothetical protein D3C75_474530 [compost metagenome]